MPFVKVYLHCVWSTKNRIPYLDSIELRQKVWNHIRENAIQKGIYIDFINGYPDHCYFLNALIVEKKIQNGPQSPWDCFSASIVRASIGNMASSTLL